MNEQTIMTLLGQAGIGGILAWYLYYTVTVAHPKIISEFRADLSEERKQRNGLYGTLRDLVDELRDRACMNTSGPCQNPASPCTNNKSQP